ncbi:MAG: hypothetical protein H6727_13885 [Myxococcales bacterium]|nr:hypothetical protein [Myxococcales bacterium]
MKINPESRPATPPSTTAKTTSTSSTQSSGPLERLREKLSDAFEARRSRPRAPSASTNSAPKQGGPVLDVASNLRNLMTGGGLPSQKVQPDIAKLQQYGAESILDNESFAGKMLDVFPNDRDYQGFQDNVMGVIQHRIGQELEGKSFASQEDANEAALQIAAEVRREAVADPQSFVGYAATQDQLRDMQEIAAGNVLDNEAFAGRFLDQMDDTQYEAFLGNVLDKIEDRVAEELGGRVFPDQEAANEAATDIAAEVRCEAVAHPENFQ